MVFEVPYNPSHYDFMISHEINLEKEFITHAVLCVRTRQGRVAWNPSVLKANLCASSAQVWLKLAAMLI